MTEAGTIPLAGLTALECLQVSLPRPHLRRDSLASAPGCPTLCRLRLFRASPLQTELGLQKTGAPWTGRQNVTVVVTSGSGGTGFIALQLAKHVYGASTVVTATTGVRTSDRLSRRVPSAPSWGGRMPL